MDQRAPSSDDKRTSQRIARIATAVEEVVKTIQDGTEISARQQQLHPTDYRCLTFLHNIGGSASPKVIIGHLGLTSGAGTALLDRLQSQGYVHRQPNPDDRRGVVITMNERATGGLLASYHAAKVRLREAIGRLDNDQLEIVGNFLDEVVDIAKLAMQEMHKAK